MGRNGLHRYNNQDHSMLTALLAVRNLRGEGHDLWSVNTEPEYHEEVRTAPTRPAPLPLPRRCPWARRWSRGSSKPSIPWPLASPRGR